MWTIVIELLRFSKAIFDQIFYYSTNKDDNIHKKCKKKILDSLKNKVSYRAEVQWSSWLTNRQTLNAHSYRVVFLLKKKAQILLVNNINIITWRLHQIFMLSNEVKLVAGWKYDSPHSTILTHPLPSCCLNELTNKLCLC